MSYTFLSLANPIRTEICAKTVYTNLRDCKDSKPNWLMGSLLVENPYHTAPSALITPSSILTIPETVHMHDCRTAKISLGSRSVYRSKIQPINGHDKPKWPATLSRLIGALTGSPVTFTPRDRLRSHSPLHNSTPNPVNPQLGNLGKTVLR